MKDDKNIRFEFGKNWLSFLETLDENKTYEAAESLKRNLNLISLDGLKFLDVGSGSGLFSLAARRLGAQVHSFDFDASSVACTQSLRDKFFPNDSRWLVQQASALDTSYLTALGKFDIIYSWGVLHHTGNMMQACENISAMVIPGGYLFIPIYNDQGGASRRWTWIKKTFNQSGIAIKGLLIIYTLFKQWTITFIKDFLSSGNPFKSWFNYSVNNRGMSAYYDLIDWVGGYPFEVAKPEKIFSFFKEKKFTLISLETCSGWIGCNEFVFQKNNE